MGSTVFLSRMIPEEHRQWVEENRINGMFGSMMSLQQKLLRGFDQLLGEDFLVCNVEPVGNYPQHFRKRWIPSFPYDHRGQGGQRDWNVGFDNLIGVKQKSMEEEVLKALNRLHRRRPMDSLVIYFPAFFFLSAAYRFGIAHPEVHICLLVPDLPDFIDQSEGVNPVEKLLQWMQNSAIRRAFQRINSMVFLTEQMSDYLQWGSRPHVVMEGIADDPGICAVSKRSQPTIVYTGTTHRQFGLPVLVEAMQYIQDPEVHLVVCGRGDYDKELQRIARENSRVEFLGVVSYEEAVALQQSAAVLVNPRQNIGEYTKYSFPSKTMEYLVTGVPVISYRLDGIPPEYFDYLATPADNTPQALAAAIEDILSKDEAERQDMGQRGRDFVLEHKNPERQVQKIVDLINGR